VGAENNTTVTDREASTSTGSVKVPGPARRGTGPMSWTSSLAPAEPSAMGGSRPEPRLRQLMGVCGWAAVLGGIGLVIGIRSLFGVLGGSAPGWYEPSIIAVGIVGIALTVGAFLTVQRRRTPWAFLGASSVVLAAAMVITTQAF
jgi:hypothetical protein